MKRAIATTLLLSAALSAPALQPGDAAPPFAASTTGGPAKLEDFTGRWLVLFFYPKALTPGCTREACSLRDGIRDLAGLQAAVLGVSLDSLALQRKFKEKHRLPFDLVGDDGKAVAEAYGVLAPSGLYARRVTFLVDPEGRIARVLDPVDTAGHAAQVANALRELQAPPPAAP